MISDEIIPILEGLDEYNMTEVSFQITACHTVWPIPPLQVGQDCLPISFNFKPFQFHHHTSPEIRIEECKILETNCTADWIKVPTFFGSCYQFQGFTDEDVLYAQIRISLISSPHLPITMRLTQMTIHQNPKQIMKVRFPPTQVERTPLTRLVRPNGDL